MSNRLFRALPLLLLLVLGGCRTLTLNRDELVGTYMQDGLIWGSVSSLALRPDSSYIFADEVVECVPDFEKGPQYGASYAKGTWRLDGDVLVLTQSECHQGNFMSTGDYGNLRYRVSRHGRDTRLIEPDKKSPFVLKKLSSEPPPSDTPEPAAQPDQAR